MNSSECQDQACDAGSLVDLLALRAAGQPERRAFSFLPERRSATPEHLTYRELQAKARSIAVKLQAIGVEEGDRVLLIQPTGLDFVAAFFGVLCAGASAVPANPPHPARLRSTIGRIEAIVAHSRPSAVVASASIRDAAVAAGRLLPASRWVVTNELNDCSEQWTPPRPDRDAVALVQYTSGSTASPKGVLVTHHNLLSNSRVIHRAFQISPETRSLIWLPHYHDMGLIGGVIQPLFGGFPLTLMPPTSFLMRPISWLEAVASEGYSVSGGPSFAFDLCVRKTTPEQRAQLDLSEWKLAFVGAEPVRHEILERFAEAFASSGFRPEAFYPCYGLAESTLFVTGGVRGKRPAVCAVSAAALKDGKVEPSREGRERMLVSCGRAAPGTKVLVVDPERRVVCDTGRVGEVWTSGDSVGRGYLDRPEETERIFGARLADSGEGPFLRTGDLGFLLDSELYLTGRLKNIIIIAGRNHAAEDIERTVEMSHPALQPGCIAAFSVEEDTEERLVIAAEFPRRTGAESGAVLPRVAELVDIIRGAVAESHDVRAHAVLLLSPATLPRTSSGKPQRHLCRERFLANSLSLVEGK